MKKIIIAAGAALTFCITGVSAAVLTVDSFDINPDTEYVSVSGTVSGGEYLQKVTLRVTSDKDGSINYITQMSTDKDGAFSASYKMTGKTGFYTAHINTENAEEDFTKQIKFTDEATVAEIMQQINICKSGDELFEYISKSEVSENLNIDIAELEKIGSVKKACGYLIGSGTEYKTAAEFMSALSGKVILAGAAGRASYEESDAFFKKYSADLKIEGTKRFEIYLAADEKLRNGIIDRVNAAEFKNEAEFSKMFEEQTVLESVKQVSGYGEVYDLLNENNDLLGLDFSTYNKIKSKSTVMQKLAGEDYKSVSDLKSAFDEACTARYKAENTSGSGSGGGGSSSSSKGSSTGSVGGIVKRDNGTQAVDNGTKNDDKTDENKDKFPDLTGYEWVKKAVEYLYDKGVVSGDENGNFNPKSAVTREQFVKMVVAAANLSAAETGGVSFTDVEKGAWYESSIYAAVGAGIVSGYPDGSFGVGKEITREDMAVLLKRMLDKTGMTGGNGGGDEFADSAEISEYARESVLYMRSAGIINGFDDGEFKPKQNATRAEAAQMLYLALSNG